MPYKGKRKSVLPFMQLSFSQKTHSKIISSSYSFLPCRIVVAPIQVQFSSNSGPILNWSCFFPPKHLHRMSIVSPSLLHRNDGQSMDYRWIIDGLSQEKEPINKVTFQRGRRNIKTTDILIKIWRSRNCFVFLQRK